jgi:hypothetical protein
LIVLESILIFLFVLFYRSKVGETSFFKYRNIFRTGADWTDLGVGKKKKLWGLLTIGEVVEPGGGQDG